ncbi:hypothetical protein ACS0TY_011345 [Phlomoides rotata]
MSGREYDDGYKEESRGTKFPVTTLTARVVAAVSLIVSAVIVRTNHVTLSNGYVFNYNDLRSFKYIFFVTLFGIGYTLLQLPFAIYYMKTKKHLINNYRFLEIDFYADKVVAFVLATGVGAAFGVTVDMKRLWGLSDDADKIQDFYTMAYIPAVFLLVASISCLVSTIHSSLTLTRN